ncbi:MAG TPA: spore germination protein GerW family protein [Chitinivibrionales bacterium]
MSLSDVIKTALDQINFIAKTDTVIGEPIHAGNVTLIPVSKVSIGFAAGGAGKDEKSGSGAGTGGGVNITPVAFISIIDDKVQVHSMSKNDLDFGKLLSLAPDLIKHVSKFMHKKDSKENSATEKTE